MISIVIMYYLLFPYILNLFYYYFGHKNSQILHHFNRLIVSFATLVIPLYLLFNYLVYNQSMLNYLYYSLLILQNVFYTFDIIPSIINKDYTNICHHLLGPVLNYFGYIYRNDENAFFICIIVYLSEQGIPFFHSLIKILDYYGMKETFLRNYIKKFYFFLMKLFLLVKIYYVILIHMKFGLKVGIFFYLQLIWNFFVIKNVLFR